MVKNILSIGLGITLGYFVIQAVGVALLYVASL